MKLSILLLLRLSQEGAIPIVVVCHDFLNSGVRTRWKIPSVDSKWRSPVLLDTSMYDNTVVIGVAKAASSILVLFQMPRNVLPNSPCLPTCTKYYGKLDSGIPPGTHCT